MNRHVFAGAGFMLAIAVIIMVLQRWPKNEPAHHMVDMTSEQELTLNCSNQKQAALWDLNKAIDDLHRGTDEWVDFNAFRARMDATLMFCFPLDRDHPDDAPQFKLTDPNRLHPTPEQLQLMYKTLDEGWNKSVVGQPWKGATRW